jgi:GR25 family glycosyltransferase involved in LPS biosynthesis
MSNYYTEKHKVEEMARVSIERKLKRLFSLRALKYIGDEKDGIRFDKDYVGYKKDGERVTFEVKVRLPPKGRRGYSDIAIETVSNDVKGTPGWIYTSKADWLVYVFIKENWEVGRFYVLEMRGLRSWFIENEYKYGIKKAPNPSYYTIFKPIPIRDIPKQLFFTERKPTQCYTNKVYYVNEVPPTTSTRLEDIFWKG